MNFDVKLYQDLTNARHRIEELEATVTSLKDRLERVENTNWMLVKRAGLDGVSDEIIATREAILKAERIE